MFGVLDICFSRCAIPIQDPDCIHSVNLNETTILINDINFAFLYNHCFYLHYTCLTSPINLFREILRNLTDQVCILHLVYPSLRNRFNAVENTREGSIHSPGRVRIFTEIHHSKCAVSPSLKCEKRPQCTFQCIYDPPAALDIGIGPRSPV